MVIIMNPIFEPENSHISLILPPHENNPRNSEGDFIRLRDGRILFAFCYYHGEGSGDHDRCDIRCVYSDDDGRTFYTGTEDGEARLLISAEPYGEKNVMSVSLLRMENGDVGVIYILKHANITDEILLSRSSDECETFYETTQILPGDWIGYYVINNCRVERLKSGRLLLPVALHDCEQKAGGGFDGRSDVLFYYSDDDGRAWHRMPVRLNMPHLTYCNSGLQEPGVTEMPNGCLYAYFRTDTGCHYEALSPDNGDHWFGPQPSRFSGPCSPLKIAKNPYTGVYYAVWNPIPNYNGRKDPTPGIWIGGRTPLAIAKGTDGYNFDFSQMQYIEDDPLRGFCYPAVFFADEKTMLLGYCSGGGSDNTCGCLTRLTVRRIELN